MNKAIILMSGGLDSLVTLGLYKADLALTFDYGQKNAVFEIEAAQKICEYYGIEHKVITISWLKDITNTALVSDKEIPDGIQDDCSSVWVPNRNGLFLNIAASFADSCGYDIILFGANREEAENFSDNSIEFVEKMNEVFQFSTQKHSKIVAPLINLDKNDIVKLALKHNMPLELINSCYVSKHCGKCESCIRLKNALIANGADKYVGLLFE